KHRENPTMKPDLFTAVMKTIGSTQDENIRTAIDSALDSLNEKVRIFMNRDRPITSIEIG
ncbi:hypothetical protein ACLEYH_23995, partial [Citrobacter braakii]